jgi:hypothetical protein
MKNANIHAETNPRNRRPFNNYSRARMRLRQIERIISDRHGRVPETDDADLYLKPVANCFYVIAAGRDRSVSVDGIMKLFWFWCRRWAPHVSSDQATAMVRHARASSPKLIADDIVGKTLRLSYADRRRLKITAIGSFDADKPARTKLARARKKERDRRRAAERRKANGATPHAASLSQTEPWKKDGVSRRTWERRRKAAAAGEVDAISSPHPYSYYRATNLRRDPQVRDVASSSSLPVVVVDQSVAGRREPTATRRAADDGVIDLELIDDGVGYAWAPPPPIDHLARAVARARSLMQGGVQ